MFKPLKVLGRGGVGKVFLVLLKGTDKVYALKQLKKSEMLLRNKVMRSNWVYRSGASSPS